MLTRTEEGPEFADWLELSKKQRPPMIALVDRVDRIVEPVHWAGEGLLRAVVATLRRCRNDSTYLQMRAEDLVATGEAARGPLLDAINELHQILTPRQRRALAHHLLERERGSTAEAREDTSQDKTETFGVSLDLSLTQIALILLRLHWVQGIYEDKADPWLERYRTTLHAFARPDFDIRDHKLAAIPILELATGLLRDAYRAIVPLLEPSQCQVAAEALEASLDEAQ